MDALREGSRAIQVKLLQRLLNKKGAIPRLREDGAFGPRTREAVLDFQTRQRIIRDGVAGPTTWSRLGITTDITHSVRLFPQPTNMTCWSAAATMIVGNMSVGPGRASTGPTGGLNSDPDNLRIFARERGWTLHQPQSWPVPALAAMMRNKPLFAVGGGTNAQGEEWNHAVVLSAMWSDGAADGSGTMLRIHDPWPPNVGRIYGRFYYGTIDGFEFISRFILVP